MPLLKPGQLPIQNVAARVKASGYCPPFPQGMNLPVGLPASSSPLNSQATAITLHDPVFWVLQLCLIVSVGIWLVLIVAFFLSTVVSGGRLLLLLMVLQPTSLNADSRI